MADELSEDWRPVGSSDAFQDEDIEQIKVGPLAIALCRARGQFYATQDLCSHEHAYLSDGVVIDCIVECPFHQGRFDVRNGRPMGAPVIIPLKTYPVKVVDGQIYIRVTEAEAESDAALQSNYGC